MKPEQRISISVSNLLLIISSFLLLVILWQVRSLIVLLMIAVILAASISPLVNLTERIRLPRWLGVIIVYLTIIFGFISVVLTIGPPVFEQIERLLRQLPLFSESISDNFRDFISSLIQSPPDCESRSHGVVELHRVAKLEARAEPECVAIGDAARYRRKCRTRVF